MSDVPAGEFSSWLRRTRRAQRVKTLGADVPCGSCNACCRSSFFVHVEPHEKKALARIPKKLLFPAPGLPKGHVLMGFNAKGHCPMLVANRCSIYEDRPQTCRDFDCRVFAATGFEVDAEARAEIAARVKEWRFDLPTAQDELERRAVLATAAFLRDRRDAFPPETLPVSATQQALFALKVYRIFLDGVSDAQDATAVAKAVMAELERFGTETLA